MELCIGRKISWTQLNIDIWALISITRNIGGDGEEHKCSI